METMISPHPTIFLTLAFLSALCGWIAIPYTLTIYNTGRMPRWIRPTRDYLNRGFRYYYPAQEARVGLATALFTSVLAILAHLYLNIDAICPGCILLLYATLLPGYLIHRAICFHKFNEFSPMRTVEVTNTLNVYRVWKVVLLWLITIAIILFALFRLTPFHWLALCTLAMGGVAIFAHFIDIFREIRESREALQGKKLRELFLELMPASYYAVFAVMSVGLTQAALWLSMPALLVVLVVFIIAFTIVEYHFRFVSPYRTDAIEQWGEEPYALLYMPEEELWMIRRRNEAALRRRNAPCWVVITESFSWPCHPRVQLTGNLEYKQREVELRQEKLLYIRRFDSVYEANSYAQNIYTDHLMDEKIRQLNPTLDNLNSYSAHALSFMNTII